jgi:hypothetical protein
MRHQGLPVLKRQYNPYLRSALRMGTLTLASKAIRKKTCTALLKSVARSWRYLVAKIGAGEGETVVLRKGETKKRD